jgi:phenylacetate-CoA ligase
VNIQDLSLLLSDKVSKRKIFSKFKEIGDFYSKSFDERKNIITAKLSFTLKNAYENIPFFYNLAEDHKINNIFLNFKIENLKEIPFMDKDTLRINRKFLLRPDFTNKIQNCYTNGSTGGRVAVAYDQESIDWSSAVMLFCRNLYGHKLINKEVHLATDTRSRGNKVERLGQFSKELVNNRSNIFIKDFKKESTFDYLKELRGHRANLLHGMPSQINGLVSESMDKFKIPFIETSGEFLRKEQRVKIEEFFSARVIDRYGLAESGIVAYQMPKQENLSVIDFHTFVEVDDSGEIVITNLNNHIMPLIRYRTGDFCEKKGSLGGFEQIKMKSGREHTLINFEGNKLNTATIEDLIFQINGVKDLQFQITKNKKIAKILVDNENPNKLDETKQIVNQYTKTNIGDNIINAKKSDFKFSGTQSKQLRVVIIDV